MRHSLHRARRPLINLYYSRNYQTRAFASTSANQVRGFDFSAASNSDPKLATREHRTIEKVLASQSKYQPCDIDAYMSSVIAARAIFLTLPPLPLDLDLSIRPPASDLSSQLAAWGILEASRAIRIDDPERSEDAAEDDLDEIELGDAPIMPEAYLEKMMNRMGESNGIAGCQIE